MPRTRILRSALASSCALALVLACGSDGGDGQFVEGSSSGGSNSGSSGFPAIVDAGRPDVDLYANDPPPPWCGPAGQPEPPRPTGTEQCPDDKNRPGCPCNTLGEKVACWTGLRKHRKLGQCKDGVATCVLLNETTTGWGSCEGQVLPTPGAKGAAACGCFSKGAWKIQNTNPCFIQYNGATGPTYAVSTVVTNGVAACPTVANTPPPAAPSSPWSENSLNVDCAGKFKLCYTIKAGSFEAPSAADCKLTEVCTEADYAKANIDQVFPVLPSWTSPDSACAKKFVDTGGYGEMTVVGKSERCDVIDNGAGQPLMFNRVKYCPLACNTNPALPECQNCQQGGGGTFP
jgi:hypothetical protein